VLAAAVCESIGGEWEPMEPHGNISLQYIVGDLVDHRSYDSSINCRCGQNGHVKSEPPRAGLMHRRAQFRHILLWQQYVNRPAAAPPQAPQAFFWRQTSNSFFPAAIARIAGM
jgi:hypothetical protein